MGDTNEIKNYINNVDKNISLNLDEINLKVKKIFLLKNNILNNKNYYITKNNLKNILYISEQKNFEKIFEIFGEKSEDGEEIITLDSLSYLYYSFTDDNPKTKFILISFLIFGKKEFIKEKELNIRIKDIFGKIENLHILFMLYALKLKDFLYNKNNNNKSHQKIKEKIIFQRHDFIKNIDLFLSEDSKILEKYSFIKEIIGASKYKLNNKNKLCLNFYCDCIKNKKSLIVNSIKQKIDELSLKNFEEILKKNKVETKLIKVIIDYLKNLTFKEYCFYKDIKYLFDNLDFSLPINNKKKFIFEIISNANNNNLNILNFGEMFDNFNLSIEKFGLLPYLEFDIKTDDIKIKRRIIH